MTVRGRKGGRILHTSDLHLNSPGDPACESLEVLVETVGRCNVDLVIVAGDFFDHNRVKDDLIDFASEQLRRFSVPVFILPGNHDPLCAESVYERASTRFHHSNIRVFRSTRGETFHLPELGISLWGKAHGPEAGFLPMKGIPHPEEDGKWHIAVAHGYYVDSHPPLFPSYHITREEVIAPGWDYIALGHVSVFRCVCDHPVKAYYSGEPSRPCGTVNLVDLSERNGIRVSPHPLTRNHERSKLP